MLNERAMVSSDETIAAAADWAPRARSARRRRSLSTRPVVSAHAQKMPPTVPSSTRTGAYENVKYVSSW
ncbi:hypothetical protein BE20_33800 [Sorangium cellulosum]|nr:hypothetical protein BE20_33800 [Sorangium cellulosum]